MSKFYTNVTQQYGKVLHRYVENGKQGFSTEDFKPYVFLKSNKKNTEYTSLYNEPLGRMDFDSLSEVRDFVKQYKDVEGFDIYGNTDFKYVFLTEEYPEDVAYDATQIETYKIDIETECENGFPNVSNANEEILLITVHISTKDLYICFVNGRHGKDLPEVDNINIKFVVCKNEQEMLEKFLAFWKLRHPDIISGWHIDGFDIPYLINRMTKILGQDETKHLSPWAKIHESSSHDVHGHEILDYEIVGISSMDYLKVYKKFTYVNRESYKLDYIASVELDEKKLSYEEHESMHLFYKNDFKKFIQYNIHDVILINKLEEKLKLLELCIAIAYQARINFQDVFSPVKTWDMLIYNYLWKKNVIIPPKKFTSKNAQFAGAYVKEPKPGMYDWVVSLDAASLYPHIIMSWNISPETLERVDYIKPESILSKSAELEYLKSENMCISANGAVHTKEFKGILPIMMEMMYEDRTRYKKEMLRIDGELQKNKTPELEKLRSKFYNFQLVTKILLNSAYGATGSAYFRYYDLRNAEAVTLNGQIIIQWVETNINDYLNKALKTKNVEYVIYCDTDSVYVNLQTLVSKFFSDEKDKIKIVNFIDKFVEEKLQKIINDSLENLSDYLNHENKISFKRESICDRGVFVAKKRYMLNVYDNEGVRYETPKIKITGLESQRSSTPEICRKSIEETYKCIMTKTKEDVFDYIDDFKEKFFKLPVEQIAFPRGVNGLEKYTNDTTIYSKGTPIHTKGSLIYNDVLRKRQLDSKYTLITEGSKVKFVHLKVPNTLRAEVIAFPSILPKELDLQSSIDYNTQYEKAYYEPIKSILSILNWNPEENLLEGLFV